MRNLLSSVASILTFSLSLTHAQSPEGRFAAMTPAELRAYERDTLQRVADLSLIPPVINTHPLPKYDYDQLDYGMTIGIARTPGGRLWAAWIGGEDGPKAFMVAATSDDDALPAFGRRHQRRVPGVDEEGQRAGGLGQCRAGCKRSRGGEEVTAIEFHCFLLFKPPDGGVFRQV